MESLATRSFIPIARSAPTRSFLEPIPEAKLESSSIVMFNEEIKGSKEEVKGAPDGQINTNVMTINFGEVEKNNHVATGDPVRCERCMAYLSLYSKYDAVTKTWACEFCDYPNILDLDEDDLPTHSIMTYVDPNQEVPSNPAVISAGTSVIFCIDVSGSMSSTTSCRARMKYMSHSGQITRLESVKLAVDDQLQKLAANVPDTKVGLVIFSDEVRIIGDSTICDYTLSCDLNNYEEVLRIARVLVGSYLTRPLSVTLPEILDKLSEIEAQGTTALGPALLLSIGLLSGQSGSKVILCTDGQANVGIGEMSDYSSNEGSQKIYQSVAELALREGIVISLVSLAEEECRLDLLAPCAHKTGGNLVKIDPTNLSEDFAEFLEEKVIAFDCTIAIKLHRAMKFVIVNPSEVGMDPSVMVKKLGNVVPTLVFTFEYTLKSPEELKQNKIDIAKLKKLPFQALLSYVGPDKLRYCKVISKTQEVTNSHEEAARNINVNILSTHSMRITGDLALQGRIREAQCVTVSYRSLLQGDHDAEETYNRAVRPLEKSVRDETTTVAFRHGHRSDQLMAHVTRTQKFPTKQFKCLTHVDYCG
eukprot:TRINITY_DN12034_c0_g4_i2.p1 TRINITY_DN12034_c0_g4~~TRINITY_DN12034_c0_g4_i2.p1  ORF type:complete len:589 (+),score=158.60 TRINITY_DN12034_c0_g4_i2:146-1912(+)